MNTPIGPEFLPDYRDAFVNSLTIPASTTHELRGDEEYDAIYVEGELRFATDAPTTLRYVTLHVNNGGRLWIGDDANPMTQQVRLIKKDMPLDTNFDPFQWGHGLIFTNGAQRIVCGKPKTAWGTMHEAASGATAITLDFDPTGWEIGDELLLPDNRQIEIGLTYNRPDLDKLPRRESRVSIAAINGRTIELTKALDFEHANAYDPDHQEFVPPCAGNLTRNVSFESENPNGVRGHSAILHTARTQTCHATFRGMGRTLTINIDNTSLDLSHIGTNQIARYADHDHHCHSAPENRRKGCVFAADESMNKWGMVTHQTSDSTVIDCIADGFVGAGFITEDGNEIRNVFEHNLACYSAGNGVNGKFNLVAPRNIPGGEGAGFWFHGNQNTVRNNRACCCAVGFQSFFRSFPTGLMVPSQVGGEPDKKFNPASALPIEFSGNVATSNKVSGFESWNQPLGWVGTNLTAANNGHAQILMGGGEGGSITVHGVKLIVQNGVPGGVSSDAAYSSQIEMTDGFIVGCSSGVKSARNLMRLANLTMQNVINVDESVNRSQNRILENVIHKQFGIRPKQFIRMGWGDVWKQGDPFPPPRHADGSWTNWQPFDSRRFIVRNWQGTGQDFLLYENNSLRNTDAWPATDKVYGHMLHSPKHGISMGECWDKYGVAYGGGVVDPAEAITLDGLVNGVGKLWDGSDPNGPPRCVLVYPNASEEPLYNQQPVTERLDLQFALTGSPLAGKYRVQLDGNPPTERLPEYPGYLPIYRNAPGAANPGQHVVKTWRLDSAGVVIPGSEMQFSYAVGETPEPPPPPPPEVWEAATVGPPFAGDMTLRVRSGVVEKRIS